MILTFPLRTLGGTASPEVTDNPVHLPATLQPVIQFPGPLASVNPLPGAVQSATFLMSTQHDQPASTVAFSVGLCTFGAGIWEANILLKIQSDFNQVPNTAQPNIVFLQNPQAGVFAVLIAAASTIGSQTYYYKDVFNFSDNNWQLFVQSIATAAAQTYELIAGVYGKRLA